MDSINQESKMEQKSLLFKESLVLSTELHLFTWTTKVESGSHRVTRAERVSTPWEGILC